MDELHSSYDVVKDRSTDDRSLVDRRSFLRLAGFTAAGLALAGCERQVVDKAIPFLVRPEEITPGVATWYASTCAGCTAGCGILIKNRDGRPIKLEGNPDHPISQGGLCVVGQAQLLGLYDSLRLKEPLVQGRPASWGSVDRTILDRLAAIRRSDGHVRFLGRSTTSPTLTAAIRKFLSPFRYGKEIFHDPVSVSAILDAHQETHGVRAVPQYHFESADVIVSFEADFLGTWISPVEFTRAYRSGRTLEGHPPRCSYHVQLESRFSLTGSRADKRVPLPPSIRREAMKELAARLETKAGSSLLGGTAMKLDVLEDCANRLWEARGRSLVVCGTNDTESQILANYINSLLGNYGSTIDLETPSARSQSDDRALHQLLDDLRAKRIDALFMAGVNPVYDLPNGKEFAELLSGVPLVVSVTDRVDETAEHATIVCPDLHPLSSWSDAEAVPGVASVLQPAIAPIGGGRALLESLSVWTGTSRTALDLIQDEWKKSVFPRQTAHRTFQEFWDRAVHDGYARVHPRRSKVKRMNTSAVKALRQPSSLPAGFELVLYPNVTVREGGHAHNAWLQETPDPITKVTWDNYAVLSPRAAEGLAVQSGDIVRLSTDGNPAALELPVWIQAGQPDTVVAVALGYGRKGTDRFTKIGPQWLEGRPSVDANGLVGVNAAPLSSWRDKHLCYERSGVRIEKTARHQSLACTQKYNSIDTPPLLGKGTEERRPLIQFAALESYAKNPAAGGREQRESMSMWPEEYPYKGAHWGMIIDLNACTGCAACIVSCQAENNIPVVGKDEVRRNREMQWMRIDRYFMQDGEDLDIAQQPMLCQQCDHAPCETVCPVLATVHSEEGLNQQIYNRCVGTRYCANNCPYKVRHFNWFNYSHEDRLQNMVLNPDVTVRSRGVMEKCSFCVQRIQEAKIKAASAGVPVADGDIKTACEQSCPAQAIVFGDMNDPKSRVAAGMKDPRKYAVLEELETRPSVGYLTMVRNRPEKPGESHD